MTFTQTTRVARSHGYLAREAVANLVAPGAPAIPGDGDAVGLVTVEDIATGARATILGDGDWLRSYLIWLGIFGVELIAGGDCWIGQDFPLERFPVEVSGWPDEWLAEISEARA